MKEDAPGSAFQLMVTEVVVISLTLIPDGISQALK
jgi:hypothetical protein